ncbi:MAG: hypothetical protein IPO15_21360 [Anaerolineae bacterium]|nr:hypothetical protein [Anaerolineae bacterium]
MDVVLAHPPEYRLMPHLLQEAQDNAKRYGGSFSVTHDMDEAFTGADVVYPKSWGCLPTTEDGGQAAKDCQEIHQLDHR